MSVIAVAGYYGFQNAGDELILQALIQQLKREEPAGRIIVFSHKPEETRRDFNVEAVDRWRPWKWLKPFREADRFILGGGGLLQESSSFVNHAYYLLLVVLAKLFQCRTEVLAIGVDPVVHPLNRWWTRKVFSLFVDQASVRDRDSRVALQRVGILRDIAVVPDLTFQLSASFAERESSKSSQIAFALAPWPQRPEWPRDLELLLSRLEQQLKVSSDFLVFFPPQDENLPQQLQNRMARNLRIRCWQQPHDLLNWIPEYALVVGMRYHALVLSALAGKPFVGWGFQRKVRTLCRDFNQPLWSFERGWDADAIFRQISEAWRQRDALPDQYRTRLAELRSTNKPRGDLVYSL